MIEFGLAVAFSSLGRWPPLVNLPGPAGLDLVINSRGSRLLGACTRPTRNATRHFSMLEFFLDPHHITHHPTPQQPAVTGFGFSTAIFVADCEPD